MKTMLYILSGAVIFIVGVFAFVFVLDIAAPHLTFSQVLKNVAVVGWIILLSVGILSIPALGCWLAYRQFRKAYNQKKYGNPKGKVLESEIKYYNSKGEVKKDRVFEEKY